MPLLSARTRFLLFPLALFYWGAIFWRNLFYSVGFFVTHRLPVPVISVGNLSVGGTGKTSTVIYLARELQQKGLKVVIISRGYKRKSSGTVLVSDGERTVSSWEEAGDEPFLMANRLPGIPVVTDEVRYRGGIFAMEKYSPQIILLDDAFQHRSLDRDIDIVLLNSQDPPDTYKLLPYGKLREPWFHLRRAQIVFWTKVNMSSLDPVLRMKVARANVPAFTSKMEADELVHDVEGNGLPLEKIKGQKTFAFCGIADPDSFRWLLGEVGLDVVGFRVFNDHHLYSKKDVESIVDAGTAAGADIFITTDKDIFKVADWAPTEAPVYSLGVHVVLSEEGEIALWQLLRAELKRNR